MSLKNLFKSVALGALLASGTLYTKDAEAFITSKSSQVQKADVIRAVQGADITVNNMNLLNGARDQAALYANKIPYSQYKRSIFQKTHNVLSSFYALANVTGVNIPFKGYTKVRDRDHKLNGKIRDAMERLGEIDRVYRIFDNIRVQHQNRQIRAQNRYIEQARLIVFKNIRNVQRPLRDAHQGLMAKHEAINGALWDHPLSTNTLVIGLTQPKNGSNIGYLTYGQDGGIILITKPENMHKFDQIAEKQLEHSLSGEFGEPERMKPRVRDYIKGVIFSTLPHVLRHKL